MNMLGQCGIDVCSPNELRFARQVGFAEQEISYTGTSMSNEDLECTRLHPGVHINCDSLSVLRRLGERCPGRSIGIRINPQVGAGLNGSLEYAGEKATKFGIFPERYEEALALAHTFDIVVRVLHFHLGSGYLNESLPKLQKALDRCAWFLERTPTVEAVDIGGGMGVPLREDMTALDLRAWAHIIASFVERHKQIKEIWIEPGDYIVKDAGLLIVEVNYVEDKGGVIFVGVNAGQNIHVNWAYYKIPFIVVPLKRRLGKPQRVTIAGNINEVGDLLAENIPLVLPEEGDFLALLNTGGYGSSMSSNHCMRGTFVEHLIAARHKL
jgi:diaminopimelate decarboxylase